MAMIIIIVIATFNIQHPAMMMITITVGEENSREKPQFT